MNTFHQNVFRELQRLDASDKQLLLEYFKASNLMELAQKCINQTSNMPTENIACTGVKNIPKKMSGVYTEDNWNEQIECVVNGLKPLAVVEYIDDPDDPENFEYYSKIGGKSAIFNHPSLLHINLDDNDGKVYYLKENEMKAKLYALVEDRKISAPDLEITRSILLGYTDNSIIAYNLANEAQYDKIVYSLLRNNPDNIEKYKKLIKVNKKWIDKMLIHPEKWLSFYEQ